MEPVALGVPGLRRIEVCKMSKAHTDGKETRAKLVASATESFANLGYDHSSLRVICANAGVTTGALYFFFDTKEDIFATVLEPLTSALRSEFASHPRCLVGGVESVRASGELDDAVARRVVEICMAHPDQLKIFLENRRQPVVSNFVNQLVDASSKQLQELFASEDYAAAHADAVAAWFARAQVETIIDILSRGYPQNEAEDEIMIMTRFIRGGLLAVIED